VSAVDGISCMETCVLVLARPDLKHHKTTSECYQHAMQYY